MKTHLALLLSAVGVPTLVDISVVVVIAVVVDDDVVLSVKPPLYLSNSLLIFPFCLSMTL